MIKNLVIAAPSLNPSKPNLSTRAVFGDTGANSAVVMVDELAIAIGEGSIEITHPTHNLSGVEKVVFRFAHRYKTAAHALGYVFASRGAQISSYDLTVLDSTEDKIAQLLVVSSMPEPAQIPKTLFIPVVNEDSASIVQAQIGLPCIIKANGAMRGEQNYKANTQEELANSIHLIGSDVLCQEWIPNEGDLRVLFIDPEQEPLVLKRTSDGESHLNNKSAGGDIEIVDSPERDLVELARNITNQLGYSICGIDLIQHSKTGIWYFLEANATPDLFNSFTSEKRTMLQRYFQDADKRVE